MRLEHGDLVIIAELLPKMCDGQLLGNLFVGEMLLRPYKGGIL